MPQKIHYHHYLHLTLHPSPQSHLPHLTSHLQTLHPSQTTTRSSIFLHQANLPGIIPLLPLLSSSLPVKISSQGTGNRVS